MTCFCMMELFLDGEVTLLTVNPIVQAMYAQCNLDGNEYLLLECFVDVQKAICLDKQKAVYNDRAYLQYATLDGYVVNRRTVPYHGRSSLVCYKLPSMP